MDVIFRKSAQMLENGRLVDFEALMEGGPGRQLGGGIAGGETEQTTVGGERRYRDLPFLNA